MDDCSSYNSSDQSPSTSEGKGTEKRIVLPSCPEPCSVCGGEATGYHYQVSSCNGCKSFFRRTIIDNRKFQCAFDNDCLIPKQLHKKQKRRKCRSCRFKRCVEVGMNRLAIVTDEDNSNTLQITKTADTLSKLSIIRIISAENLKEYSLQDLLYSEIKLGLLRKSTYNFRPDCGFTIESLLEQRTPLGSSFPEMPPLVNLRMPLFDTEFHLKNRIPLPFMDYSKFPSNFKVWFYMDIVYQLAWITSFEFFKSLDQADQIVLVRMVTMQLIVLTTSYFSYTLKASVSTFPDGSYYTWSFERIFDVIRNCFDVNLQHGEYALLKILLLCNPAWEQLSSTARQSLSVVQQKYTNILMDHCLREHGSTEGPARMATLLQLNNAVICKAAKARSRLEIMTILRIRSNRDILVEQIAGVEKL